jgi:CubicO group peptidase (beta-lactamase class C family)
MVTALGFMSENSIDLDTDISTYLRAPLRGPAFPDTPITCRMLLSHTSGLRNGADFPVPFNRSLLARLDAAAREPNYGGWFAPAHEPPGAWFSYSDTNFAIIAEIIEHVTGTRFDRFMRERLFTPLRLDIGYNWSGVSQRKRARAAAACRWVDGAWTPQVDANPPRSPEIAFYRGDGDPNSTEADYRIGENGFAFAPHGGLRLSLSDMDALARHFLSESEALAPMRTPAWTYDPAAPNGAIENGFYQAYGLGLQMPLGRASDSFFGADSADWRGHCGDAYGWMTGIWWNARTRITLVYAINGMPETDRPRAVTALTAPEQAIVDLALDDVAG